MKREPLVDRMLRKLGLLDECFEEEATLEEAVQSHIATDWHTAELRFVQHQIEAFADWIVAEEKKRLAA